MENHEGQWTPCAGKAMIDIDRIVYNLTCRDICKKSEHRGKYSILLEALDLVEKGQLDVIEDNIRYMSVAPILKEASDILDKMNIPQRIGILRLFDRHDRHVFIQKNNLCCPHSVIFILEGFDAAYRESSYNDIRFYYTIITSSLFDVLD